MKFRSLIAAILASCLMVMPVHAEGILKGSSARISSTGTLGNRTSLAPAVKSTGIFGEQYAIIGSTYVVLPPKDSEISQPTFAKKQGETYQASYSIDRKKQYSANDQAVISIIDSWYKSGETETITVKTTSGEKQITGKFDYNAAKQIFMNVNEKRLAAKASALSWDASLYEVAKQRAAEISVYNSHTRPDGSQYFTAGTGINGENIAYGYASAQIAMDEWMSSAGHKANILRPTFKYFAASSFVTSGYRYWVQNFGGY